MKSKIFAAGLAVTSAIAATSYSQVSVAATFGQTEVNQDQFIAIAVPRGNDYYNLTILEQQSNQRRCWNESGQSPTIIDPLLLQFNFSGICGRSADSNGYSIRHRGKDLGMQYRLTLKRSGNDVLLLGQPSSSRAQPVILGRTGGVSSSLMKINLDPGWKYTKRNYQGKTLGHIYLTHEGTLPMGGTIKTPYPTTSRTTSKPPSLSKVVQTSPVFSRPVARATTSDRLYRLYVKTSSSRQERLVKALVPGAFRSTYRGQSVMQAGLFSDRSKARALEKSLKRRGLRTALMEEKNKISTIKPPSSSSSFPVAAAGPVLKVPSSRVPLGNARGEGDVYGRGNTSTPPPPPNPTLALAKRYRVLVSAPSSRQQSKVRSLVSGAFRSSYRGQSMMQVGSFTNMSEAQGVIQLMTRNGFRPVVD